MVKLRMELTTSADEVNKTYANEAVRISTVGENLTIIEAECTLQEAVRLVEMDSSRGDRSIEIKRG